MKLTQLTPILLLTLPSLGSAASNISPTEKYAWSTNAGWVNFSPANGGVTVATDHLEGYAWAENIGWIKLGTYTGSGNYTYGNTGAADYGINRDPAGNLSGYAWSTNVGWIKYNPTNGGVTVDQTTGRFDGYAWSENVGWIHFQNASPAYVVRYTVIPTVLSVSSSTGAEAAATVVTVTATSSSAVVGDQTVDLTVTGLNAGDYSLSGTTITIANGQTTGTVTFTIVDDTEVESTETATLTLSNPSAGITLGATSSQTISITDNDTAGGTTVNNSGNTGNTSGTSENTPIIPPPLPPMTLTVSFAGTGTGSIASTPAGLDCSPTSALCTHTVTTPTWVTLTATPAQGSQLSQWGGDSACRSDGKVFLMADTTCRATFELQSYEVTVGRFGQGHVTGPGIDCPPECTKTFLYGTEVQFEAKADREWIHTGWKWSCDDTGKLKVTQAHLCQAVFEPDLGGPNLGDGNGDGVADAYQPNVISLPDKVSGKYVTFEVQPETCAISDIYTDLPENYGKPATNQRMPQGLIYFELACPQAQISLYNHALTQLRRNLVFQKYGPTVPGEEQTIDWYRLPNVTFGTVTVGDQTVVKAMYTLTDGGLGDSTGVDGRIVDPGGLGLK